MGRGQVPGAVGIGNAHYNHLRTNRIPVHLAQLLDHTYYGGEEMAVSVQQINNRIPLSRTGFPAIGYIDPGYFLCSFQDPGLETVDSADADLVIGLG